jgi:hypothetical protein
MQRPIVSTIIRTLALSALLFAAEGTVGRPATVHAQYDNCGLPPNTDDRAITSRRHISCPEAKQVLLQLKGIRDTVPMVCRRPRVVQGWRLTNPQRAFGVVFTRYQRGKVSFFYERIDHLGKRAWCRPPFGSGEDVG